ncbi:MAG: serine/threonine-protein phosphatase [Bacteroidales bacterium]|nr:serine/threonine-protein phosphatase [Bacteroidales bacterium]
MRNRENIKFCGLTDTGKRRTNNEDAFVAERLDDGTVLAIVIDGVGGYEGGKVAAEIAQKEIPSYMKKFNRGERLELLKQAVVCANNAIFDRRQLDTARPNMSCVLTSALIDADRKVIDMVHVGDTRMYQYHNGVLLKLSHDHSYVGYCEEIGELTEEQAMHHPRRNEISRAVGEERHGVSDQSFLEAVEHPLLPDSILLLCSDGLTDLVTSAQIVSILEQDVSLEEKTKQLINAANEEGGKDNITVVLVEYHATEEDPKEQEGPEGQNHTGTETVQRGRKDFLLAIIAFAIVALSLPCFALWKHFHGQSIQEGNSDSDKIVPMQGVHCDSVEGKEFTFMYDMDSNHPWSSYLSTDSNYVLRLEKLYEDSLGCSYRALIFEPEYWYRGAMHYPPFGEEPTYVGYGTDRYDGYKDQYLELSFIRGDIGPSGDAYAFVLSGHVSNWDSLLTSNPVPAPWLSDEADNDITFKKQDW